MNREIKFRVWCDNPKKMVYDDMLFINGASDGGSASLETTIFNLKQEYELMQYTGYDIANEEIWEGDVCFSQLFNSTVLIEFKNGLFGVDCEGGFMPITTAKLTKKIGNIYENPDLLK